MNTHLQRSHISSFNRPVLLRLRQFLRRSPFHTFVQFVRDAKSYKARHLIGLVLGTLLLALPAAGYLLATLSGSVTSNLAMTRTISVFLTTSEALPGPQETVAALRSNLHIHTASVVNPDVELVTVASGTVAMLEVVPENNLDSQSVNQLIEQLQALAGVEHVAFDDTVLARNNKAQRYLHTVTAVLYAITTILVVLLVRQLVRRDVTNGADVIALKIRLGATLQQVRTPFLYRAILISLFASAVGTLMVGALLTIATQLVDYTSISFQPSADIKQILLFTGIVLLTSLTVTNQTVRKFISK